MRATSLAYRGVARARGVSVESLEEIPSSDPRWGAFDGSYGEADTRARGDTQPRMESIDVWSVGAGHF
jgi:hypothetical protein